ncbi:MAG: MerR family transcriptional regulator [Phycisphaerae bacterium]|nr:MerR family transcriptional regulator [Phycisphaerae bacterium]
MRISAAAAAAGVTRQTVEYYIMIGLIEPRRDPNRRGRFFDAALVKRVKLIRKLNNSGYTLRDIRDIYFKRK